MKIHYSYSEGIVILEEKAKSGDWEKCKEITDCFGKSDNMKRVDRGIWHLESS